MPKSDEVNGYIHFSRIWELADKYTFVETSIDLDCEQKESQ